jgi:type IX secretion system PorP/SprF family membrane protein
MKSKISALLILCLLSLSSYAQQDPVYSLYLNNPFLLNPAYAGFNKVLSVSANHRSQWQGIQGSPTSFSASANMPLHNNKMGAGLIMFNDQIGSSKTTEVHAVYSYKVELDPNRTITFGLQAGAVNYQNDFSDLTIDPDDPKFQQNISETSPSFGTGIIYSTDKLFVGVSVPRLMNTTLEDSLTTAIYNRHLYVNAAYLLHLSPLFKLKPFLLMRHVKGAALSMDIGASCIATDKYVLGLFMRNFHTVGLLSQLNLSDALRIGYAFELPTARTPDVNFSVHEFSISFRFSLLRFHDITEISDF